MPAFPRLYAIADAHILASRGLLCHEFASAMAAAGVQMLQYRDKAGSPQAILNALSHLRTGLQGRPCRLIVNDHPDLAVLAHADGVHVGQDDLSPADTRSVVGPQRIIGVSTHSDTQVKIASTTPADYIAIGPVFATFSKSNHEPVVGLEGIGRARSLTDKPLVAIGGITRDNARSVLEAGADSVAVISALTPPGESPAKVARDFLEMLL